MRNLALLVVLAACASPAADRDSLPQSYGLSVAPLMTFPRGYGSSFCVRVADGKTWLLTARHVVEGVPRMAVVFGRKAYPAVVESVHPLGDMALVRVDAEFGMVPLPLASSLPAPGSRVIVLGCPGGRPFEPRATEGFLGWMPGTMSAAVAPGSSGGPVLHGGRVFGLSVQIADVPLWHVSYYAAIDRGWLRKCGVLK